MHEDPAPPETADKENEENHKPPSHFANFFHRLAHSGLHSAILRTAARTTAKSSSSPNRSQDAAAESEATANEIIKNVTRARNLTVEDAMVPRADIAFLSADMSADEVVAAIEKHPHTRYAVCGENTDDVLGMTHIKDVLLAIANSNNGEFSLRNMLHSVLFVAPSMRVMDLLLRMRVNGVHLAMVVDEYGGIDGQIALSDLIEELIGDIRDRYNNGSEPAMNRTNDGSYVVDGRYNLEDFQQRIGHVWEAESEHGSVESGVDLQDIDTVGGLVMALAGRLPLQGEVIRHDSSGLEFHIMQADPRHIRRLRVYKR